MPRGKNQEIYALGEFPLCKVDKRVSMPSRLEERSQSPRLPPNGKEMRGEGQEERSRTRVWMPRKMEAPAVGTGLPTPWSHQGRAARGAGSRNRDSAKTGSVGAHSSEEIWNFAP